MSTRVGRRGLLVLMGLLVPVSVALGRAPEAQHPETKQLAALVRRAAAQVKSRGEAVFPEFRKKGGEWWREDDSYIFVLDKDGVAVVHPARPEFEGKSQIDSRDVHGKPYIQSFLRASADREKSGWAHYMWPPARGGEPAWKAAHLIRVAAPSGKEYVVGSGFYPRRTDRMFVTTAVDEAVTLLKKQGEGAFPTFRDRAGDFIFGDVYLFILDLQGKALVHAGFPELEGRSLLDLKDVDGKPFIRDMLRLLQFRSSGWVDYRWPKPGQTTPSRKSSYVRRVTVGGKTLLVGSGAYLE